MYTHVLLFTAMLFSPMLVPETRWSDVKQEDAELLKVTAGAMLKEHFLPIIVKIFQQQNQ